MFDVNLNTVMIFRSKYYNTPNNSFSNYLFRYYHASHELIGSEEIVLADNELFFDVLDDQYLLVFNSFIEDNFSGEMEGDSFSDTVRSFHYFYLGGSNFYPIEEMEMDFALKRKNELEKEIDRNDIFEVELLEQLNLLCPN